MIRSGFLAAVALAALVHTGDAAAHFVPCVDGDAEGHACNNVDLVAHMSLGELGTLGSGNANDMWGWTDPQSGKEYALVGLDNGTAFIDISDPEHPVRLGNLPTHSVDSLWRDVKVYQNHALIVSEAADHGLQVFDLTRLRNVAAPPVVFTEDAWYGEFGRAHNIVVNEQSGFAYAVGSRQGSQQCNAGLHMIDIHDPLDPQFAGCFSTDGYTHDAQCIVYDGPDADHVGDEICFAANEDTLTIVDVTEKANPQQLYRISYDGVGYAHQGWLTEDRRHFLLDDELDEMNSGGNTRTYVWDVQDLEQPVLAFTYHGPVGSSDHNLYTLGSYAYASNYNSGLRILGLSDIDAGSLSEVAFFDTYVPNDAPGFDGTWSNYPYYASGLVGVSDITSGFYLLQPNLCVAPAVATGLTAQGNGSNRIDLAWTASTTPGATYTIDRTLGGCSGGQTETIAQAIAGTSFSDTTASGDVMYGYRVRAVAASGECAAVASTCVEAQTVGACTAPPAFGGIAAAASAGTPSCAVQVSWQAAAPFCGASANYLVYRSTDPLFTPDAASLVDSGLSGLSWMDQAAEPNTDYTYVVRAVDAENGSEDANLVRLGARATGPLADGDWISGAELGQPVLAGNVGAPAPMHVAWEVVDSIAHSGLRSYWSGYNNQECLAIGTGPIALSAGESSSLEFWTRYGIEAGWDGGIVQVSADGGATWSTIAPNGGYPGTIQHDNNACAYEVGTAAYSGTNLAWTPQQFDLSAWAGQTVEVRWQFGTDTAQTEEGWWIDDIRIAHAQVPGECSLDLDLIFANGFDP